MRYRRTDDLGLSERDMARIRAAEKAATQRGAPVGGGSGPSEDSSPPDPPSVPIRSTDVLPGKKKGRRTMT